MNQAHGLMSSVARSMVMLVVCLGYAARPALAQGSARREPVPPAATDSVSPAEIQRLFDAYVAMQAQQALQLTDEQYPRFLARIKALQAARQHGAVEHA